jgi:hypothetical protein
MIVDRDTMCCFELVAKDLCEALAADRMLANIGRRHQSLARFNGSEAGFGLNFIKQALQQRMALAVTRTLQGASNDRTSFARLLKLAKAARHNTDLSGFEKRLGELRNAAAARKLQECRNGFMAHTLVGEPSARGRMKVYLVADLLYKLTDLYEDIHRAVTGTEDRVISGTWEKWHERALHMWNALVGIEEPEETEFAYLAD